MNRRSFPTGQGSAALLKALRVVLEEQRGKPASEAWLRGQRLQPEDLDDETRLLPLPTIHRALAAFAEVASREAVRGAARHLLAPDGLGVWTRVVRGTSEPAEAFARLDASESEYGRTTRWETLEAMRGRWRGRVLLAHDPALEQDGLLALARLAELEAVPALYGMAGTTARLLASSSSSQEYEVIWPTPDGRPGAAVGAVLGGLTGALPLLVHAVAGPAAYALVALGLGSGGFLGILRAREKARHADARAQSLRVRVLERSLALKDAPGREIGGQLEGTVAAGQYRIVRRMGSGATGVIYEAVRISDGLPVAIKLLRAAAAHEAIASDRLRREAEALGLSWHPNVVEVIDEGHLPDGTAYLVMELLRGESLAARLVSKGRLTPRELLPVAMQVCDALAAVHAAGVVHRDLKPSNIFLAIDREDPVGSERVKLLDFGIARVEWEETRITHTGGPLGTQGYMSPEQEAGTADVDGRSDLFALGATIFECLVGEPPPPRNASGPMAVDAVRARLDSGTQRSAPLVPPRWRTVIERAMQPKVEDRYQDARAFAHDLRAVREDLATEASS